jgi:hypothetical protein
MEKQKVFLANYIIVEDEKDTTQSPIIRSIEIPLRKKGPSKKLISIFGSKSILEVLSKARRDAAKNNFKLYRVDLTIDGGNIPKGKTTLAALSDVFFLNLEKIQADLASTIMEIIVNPNDKLDKETPNYVIGKYPKRLNRLWKHPQFKHIVAFSWGAPISKGKPKHIKLAATKTTSDFTSIDIRNYTGNVADVNFEV